MYTYNFLRIDFYDPLAQLKNDFLTIANDIIMPKMQLSGFDSLTLWVAIITCVIAIITCVFAYCQLRMQNKEFCENHTKDKIMRLRTETYVNQIRKQILNNSLICIIKKKYSLLEDHNNLYDYLSKNKTVLLKSQKGKVGIIALQDINKIYSNLNILTDTISIFEKKGRDDECHLEQISEEIIKLLKVIERQEGVGDDLTDVEKWLKRFKEKRLELFKTIDNSYYRIRQNMIE